jgi:prepilin-type N-terminal cleavage/methylation domain-containing protein
MSTSLPRRRRAGAGFTLIELMLSIAILAIILIMIAGSFNVVIHSKVQGEARLDVDRQGRSILWQLSNEIRGAVQTPNPPSNVLLIGLGQMRSGMPVDAITVSTLEAGHRRAITGMDAEEVVSYSVTPNPQARGWYVLSRSQWSALMGINGASAMPPTQLADNVIGLHIKYFNGGDWLESWDSTALPPPAQLPLAVSIDLLLATGTGSPMEFSTEVVLPMAIPVW